MYRLIIADDEESIRHGMAHSLPWNELGFEVVALCENGQQVLDGLAEYRPDVVISDIRMPVMDGVELMRRLNHDHPEIKMIILSGYSDFEYLNESIRNHVAEYLLKPTDIDEFEETMRRIKTSLDQERVRSAQIGESVKRHLEVWLLSMMHGTASEQETERFMPRLAELGIDLDNLVVAVFTLGGHGGDESRDRAEAWHRIRSLGESLPADAFHRMLVLDGEEQLLVLYSSEEEITEELVAEEIRRFQSAVREQLREVLTAGVGSLCTEPEMLPQVYGQAKCCARQGVFLGEGSICHFRDLVNVRTGDLPHFDYEVIERALLGQDYDAIDHELNRVFAAYKVPMQDYQYLDRLCLSLLFHVSLWGLRYDLQMEDVLHSLGTAYTDIFRCDTMHRKQTYVLAILFACQKALAEHKEQGSIANSVARRVQNYVDSEFASNTISLESVAAYVQKTPAYISRLFKNEMGTNFSDYLTHKRMQMAAELLQDPNARVYTVAEQCGYADPSNFIRVFKRTYGISPAEYRTASGGHL